MRALLACLLVSRTAHAGIEGKGVHVGATFMGLSSIDENAPDSQKANPDPGWLVGAFVTFRQSPTFAIQLEADVSDKRYFVEHCAPSCMNTGKISLWYFEVPGLLRLDLLPGRAKFHLDAGAELAIPLGGTRSFDAGGADLQFSELLPMNFGGVIGAGLEIPVGVGAITLDVRYKHWVLDVTGTTTSGEPTEGLGGTNKHVSSSHQIALVAGYAFP